MTDPGAFRSSLVSLRYLAGGACSSILLLPGASLYYGYSGGKVLRALP